MLNLTADVSLGQFYVLTPESGLADTERRLASYRSRTGKTFAFGEDLAAKRRELAEVESALASEATTPAESQRVAA